MTATDAPAPAAVDGLIPTLERWLFTDTGDLTIDEARAVTAKAKGYIGATHRILERAHERRIWVALGHNSWHEYVAAEFQIGRSRSYQLVDFGVIERAIAGGTVEPDADPLLNEAAARHMAPIKHDTRAVRQVWARALELARGTDPTASVVEQAMSEYRDPPAFEVPDLPLTQQRVAWASGPVWWHWRTPPEGTELLLGLGEPGVGDLARSAWFVSPARYGDSDRVRDLDARGLLPWLIAELLAGGSTMPDDDLVAAVVDLDLEHIGRGPYSIDRSELLEAVADLELDNVDDWRDVADTRAAELDDEVLHGELVDRSPQPTSPDAAVPQSQSAVSTPSSASAGADREPPPDQAPAHTPRVTVDDVESLGVDELAEQLAVAAHAARTSVDPDELELAAQWGRAFASHAMSRKAELEGTGS